jgi:HAE1 family hydrophobic/amphiphilic exporter-1
MDFAALSVREALKTVSLPDEADIPMIFRWNPALDPVLRANISSQTNLRDLTSLVENKIRPRCERIPGVAAIDVLGTIHPEIRIKIDPDRLASHGINLFYLVNILKEENIQTQVGTFREGRYELAIHLSSQFLGPEDIKNLPLRVGLQKKTIHLRDIAEVSETDEDPKSIARTENRESISLSIKKMHQAHTLDVIDGIKHELSQIEKEFPVSISYSKDDSLYIKMSRRTLFSNLWQGFLFTFICVFLFLRSLAATFVIAIAIPISTIGTFALMKFFNISQNVFSLAGFTLASGMVVDCSIVILENIYRQMTEEGKAPWRAAVEGTQEVGIGVLTSTLTTMAIFIPIVLCIKGVVGILFNDIAFTFTITMALSMLIGFSLIPCACAYLLEKESKRAKQTSSSVERSFLKRYSYLEKIAASTQHFFIRTVSFFLDHRKPALAFVCLIYGIHFFSIFLLPGTDLIPLGEFKEFVVKIKGEKGTPLASINEKTKPVEAALLSRKEIETIDTTIEKEESKIFVRLKKGELSLRRADANLSDIRNQLKPYAEIDIEVLDQPKFDSTEGQGSPLIIVVKHADPALRKSLTRQISNSLKQIPDLLYLSTTDEKNRPEIQITLDHRKLRDHALTTEEVADLIYAEMEGIEATSISQKLGILDRPLPIRVVHEGTKRLQELKELPLLVDLKSGNETIRKILPLSLFSSIQERTGNEVHERTDGVASETIFAHFKTDRRSLTEIMKEIKRSIDAPLISSNDVTIESSLKVFQDAFSDLYIALIIAIILVYMILAAQFESFVQPLVLILTLPLAATGVLIGVKLWGFYMNVIVMLGVILLVGIAVENGILLIEYTNILRKRGLDRKEAILTAIRCKMRPIFITSLTDITGTIPMAFSSGAGAEMYQGFAVVTIFGMATATVFTLLVLPLTYALAEDARDFSSLGWLKIKTMLLSEKGEQP